MRPLASLVLALAYALTPLLAFAEGILIAGHDPELTFALSEERSSEGSTVKLLLQLSSDTAISTLVLENPLRLVIDLPPSKSIKNKNLNIEKGAAISALRIGSHSDKLRLVLDIRGTLAPEVSTTTSDQGTEIQLVIKKPSPTRPTPVAVATVQVIIPTAEPTEIPAYTATPESTATAVAATATTKPSATAAPEPTHTAVPTFTPVPTFTIPAATAASSPVPATSIPTIAPSVEQSASPHLLEFGFEYSSEHIPVIRITLTERSEFKLSKADERLYKLTIPGSSLASLALKLPQFPPHDFVGFTFLQASQQAAGVEVKIGVERGTRISALPQDKDILVRTLGK